MPKPKKGPRLGAGPADQRKILSNLAKSLIEHGSINTTVTRAKTLQPYVEKLITKAKKGDLHNRRLVAKELPTQSSKYERGFDAVYTLFDEVVPRLDPEREGGYTRIVKIGNRRGDNAPMANISIIFDKVEKKAVVKEAENATKKAAKKASEDETVKDEAEDLQADALEQETVEGADTANNEADTDATADSSEDKEKDAE
ncbi:MAG: 50S ribosomal protein L17 [Actinomycetaceae bacterium]|nr:50S ribosomal protein L17 [Actinomycetaceae bacterium]